MANLRGKNQLPIGQPFDYQLAMDRLQDYRSPRDKLRQLCDSGKLVRVKKGLYVPGWMDGEMPSVDPRVLAGLIYGPSYISLESALSHYGLIPERVAEITCVTIKRARQFRTPLGSFRYAPVNERVFGCGMTIEPARGGTFFLAEPEKALCDRIARIRGLSAAREVPHMIEADLRIDLNAVRQMSLSIIADIARRYRRNNVSAFHRWLTKELRSLGPNRATTTTAQTR